MYDHFPAMNHTPGFCGNTWEYCIYYNDKKRRGHIFLLRYKSNLLKNGLKKPLISDTFLTPWHFRGRRGITVACVCPSVRQFVFPPVRKLYPARTISADIIVLYFAGYKPAANREQVAICQRQIRQSSSFNMNSNNLCKTNVYSKNINVEISHTVAFGNRKYSE